jgi:hypothetical protein
MRTISAVAQSLEKPAQRLAIAACGATMMITMMMMWRLANNGTRLPVL